MKSIVEHSRIQPYISQFNLDEIFAESEAITLQLRTYERNELVLKEGDELDGLYFQVEGQTRVSSSVSTGKSLLLRYCHPLSVFGDIELIQKVVIQSQVEAVQPASFLFIDHRTVESVLMQDSKFLNMLLKHLSYKLQTCTTASRINLLASVEERLASYLLTIRLQNEFGKELQTSHIPEIASLIGTTPRHLNRVIRKLSERKIISKAKKHLHVNDWERLDELSSGLRYE
ncbi:Crp/Fnr family transcriptional regulator [Paenibacillus spongiae]|uniref:Crp/Fnr family transcriptional regulator n=1 Tax=Paenibacillus spongiae TaxID=2909671 RepID=A0ABY5S5G2_9BACL|nr:Crp/Fnr family transcriptional regulator [Paenibacillus spongiae]UVI28075.1 Crp/Fnr family transcriptional regulator [Paenibacillus spongiae]